MSVNLIDLTGAGLCTLAQVKERIGIKSTASDTKIQTLITALTPTVNARYGREFMQSAATLRIVPVRSRVVDLMPYDLRAATLVRLSPEAALPTTLTANTDYALGPADRLTATYGTVRLANALNLMTDFETTFGYAQLEITGTWGIWATTADVPGDINQAAVECILSLIDRPSATIPGVDGGGPREAGPTIPSTWDIPAGAHRKFQRYNRELGVW